MPPLSRRDDLISNEALFYRARNLIADAKASLDKTDYGVSFEELQSLDKAFDEFQERFSFLLNQTDKRKVG